MTRRASYFVSHLLPEIYPDATGSFEIQILNDCGQGIAVGYFDGAGEDVVIDGQNIPAAVVEATLTLPMGFGYYVNDEGAWVDPWGQPTVPLPADREQLAHMLLEGGQRLINTGVRRGEMWLRAVVKYYGETSAADAASVLIGED